MRVNFDISEIILEVSGGEAPAPRTIGSTIISTPVIAERRRILQRGLNLHDSAKDLLTYMRNNGRNIRGDKASQTSSDTFSVSPTEADQTIDSVDSLSGISTGSFSINGVYIQVDTSTDTFNDLIDRINYAGAGVKVTYDFSNEELTIDSLQSGMVRAEDGSANFFEGTNLVDGIFTGDEGFKFDEFLTSPTFQRKLSRFTGHFNKLFKLDFDMAFPKDYKKEIVTNDGINLEYTTEENLKEELQKLTLNSINKFIDPDFTSGALRLASDLEMVNSDKLFYFSQSTVAFGSNDEAKDLYDFLESTNAFLSQSVNSTDRHNGELKSKTNDGGTTGLMVGELL